MTHSPSCQRRTEALQAVVPILKILNSGEFKELADVRKAAALPCDCAELMALRRVVEYAEHEKDCICNRFEAGEPTPDGGYRCKYAGTWYQAKPIDETPPCNCGFDDALAALPKEQP